MSFRETVLNINGAPLEGESPLPKFRNRKPNVPKALGDFPEGLLEGSGCQQRVLPYTVQDRYSRVRVPMRLKCFVLENEYLKAEFLPEYGGRLHSLYDKVNGCDLLFTNTVIQPCNLAIRNAWLSGGIEWNIGNLGHTYTTCDNVFCARLRDGEGNDFIRIYEFERLKSIFWQVDFHLPKGSRHLITHVKMVNPFPVDTTTYWWSNVAVPDNGKTRVLASGERVISFIFGNMMYEELPDLKAMPGDVSYTRVATRSFDFFIQPNYPEECTWEAAAYDSGVVLYERSTPPLSYKKLYVWGAHRAGDHWQEFLSEDGKGYYAEIQAGIAPSQLHDKLFPANTTYEWTQIYGSVRGDTDRLYDKDYKRAVKYLGEIIDGEMSAEDITSLDKRLCALASLPVSADMLIHTGSGFGALEALRMEKDGDGRIPESMYFPAFTIGKYEYPWYNLLTEGILPPDGTRRVLPTFMISDKWLPHLKASLEREGGRNWYSLYQYGISVYEGLDNTKLITDAATDEDVGARRAEAERAWLESVSLCPTAVVYRALGVLEYQRGNLEGAEEYYRAAMSQEGAYDDFAILNEYIDTLVNLGKYEAAWAEYEGAPEALRAADRLKVTVSTAAVKLDKLDFLEQFFAEEHHTIREGEDTVTDVWFEMHARRMARERGISLDDTEAFDALLDEAWQTCEPHVMHDFRQSYSRKERYRV